MKAHFEMMARYNAWANGRLYDAARRLDDADYRRDCGAFFGSLMGTLNHLLVADTIWMARFRGRANPPWKLNQIIHEDLAGLREARGAMDGEIVDFVGALDEDGLAREFTYSTITNPRSFTQRLRDALAHFFNHQTHHRGQCHAILTRLGAEAPSLDLLILQREG